ALEAEFSGPDWSVATYGVLSEYAHMPITIAMLAAPGKSGLWGGHGPKEGPVEYANVTLNDDRVIACVQNGLFLAKRGSEPFAIMMSGPAKEFHPSPQVSVQVMGMDREAAERFLAGLRTAMRKRNVYRGHVLSLIDTRMGGFEIKFHRLPAISRENIILPE